MNHIWHRTGRPRQRTDFRLLPPNDQRVRRVELTSMGHSTSAEVANRRAFRLASADRNQRLPRRTDRPSLPFLLFQTKYIGDVILTERVGRRMIKLIGSDVRAES